MELPFLKNRKNQGGGGPSVTRESESPDLMSGVLDELIQAFETKDKGLLMDALRAVVLHIQDEDAQGDGS